MSNTKTKKTSVRLEAARSAGEARIKHDKHDGISPADVTYENVNSRPQCP
jgi:hypothetical protein